jgi:hypothetical protein
MQLEEKRRIARAAFIKRDYEASLELSLDLSKYCDPDAYYRCAIIYETVKKDFEKAYYFFNRLRVEYEDFDAYNGCVRLILKMHKVEDNLLAEEYCETAIRKRGDGISYLLLGRVMEELYQTKCGKSASHVFERCSKARSLGNAQVCRTGI